MHYNCIAIAGYVYCVFKFIFEVSIKLRAHACVMLKSYSCYIAKAFCKAIKHAVHVVTRTFLRLQNKQANCVY